MNTKVGMSGALVPTAELYDKYFFTPEQEPCQARYLFDKELADNEGIKQVEIDLKDFPSYIESLSAHDKFSNLLKYEKIEIVEKEDSPPIT